MFLLQIIEHDGVELHRVAAKRVQVLRRLSPQVNDAQGPVVDHMHGDEDHVGV